MTKPTDAFSTPVTLAKSTAGVVVAALDMGSNSFHLVVVRGHGPTQFDILLKEKVMMRLGDEVARTGRISDESKVRIKETVATMANLARGSGASEMVALATAAFRDAKNSGSIVDELEESLGIKVSVISGKREAELIWRAISHAVDFEGQTVLGADLGGGSLEITVGSQDKLLFSESFNVGVGRLTTEFKNIKLASGIHIREVNLHLEKILGSAFREIVQVHKPTKLILSSGSFLNIARITLLRNAKTLRGDRSLNQAAIQIDEIRAVIGELTTRDVRERSKIPGIDEKRVDLLPAAALVAQFILNKLEPSTIVTSDWALREGIILRELSTRNETEFSENSASVKLASVLGVANRYGWNEGHSRHVAALAVSIFDQTTNLHQLGDLDRELLYLSALVHDIGEYISVEGHDRHGAYLLENSRLAGFDKEMKNKFVSIVRYHRRGNPKSDFVPFADLSKENASTVIKLAAILRLADALDRSHTRLVEHVEVVIKDMMLLLLVSSSHQVELEEYGLRRKRQLFEETFSKEVHLVQIPNANGTLHA